MVILIIIMMYLLVVLVVERAALLVVVIFLQKDVVVIHLVIIIILHPVKTRLGGVDRFTVLQHLLVLLVGLIGVLVRSAVGEGLRLKVMAVETLKHRHAILNLVVVSI